MHQPTFQLHHAHHNRQLFSNHFLENRLPEDEIWAAAAEADRLRDELRSLFEEQEAALGAANEAQTEERWIRPVLDALGWGYEVQPRSVRMGATRYPDYALFLTQADADRVVTTRDAREVLRDAVGVLEAKRWARSLDGRGGGDDLAPERIPSAQIVNYLVRTQQPWGILTNGAEWRLYYRDADFADTVYFAVHLPALLGEDHLPVGDSARLMPAVEAFRYFYLFFRPDAFAPGPDGRRWLDLARERSTRYARSVEDALKPRAYRAVTALCRGFVTATGQDPAEVAEDPEQARQVLDNALTVLFRLLFILYAESRELLPVRTNPAYRNKSLLQLRERAAGVRDRHQDVFPLGRDFWSDLSDLFAIIDGDPAWRGVGVPIYDGGLFDPEQHPWLNDHHVPDPHLAEAIDLLSRVADPDTDRAHYVDYGPLDVRHLGSIYEGLLEHVIRVANEPLPAIREQGVVVRDPVETGELYLANDRGERKVTGSYYTPDYIVEYIVERTLGPLVEDRSVPEILELRILDPAMGSGHFLVAATSYLARSAVRAAADEEQQVLGDFAELTPDHIRRLVVERCIFGVDRNARAVELAKLALWLATVQKDKPLNFLDHHLKRGDSLLGARLADLGRLPGGRGRAADLEAAGQIGAFEYAFQQQVFKILGFIRQIEDLPSDSLDDVELKERLYAQADAMLDRYRDVADLWSSRSFGNDLDGDQYARAMDGLRAPEETWTELATEPWFQSAKALWREHRFFHWDVEFAEVFFDERGEHRDDPGFDAVVGNPPYVRMEEFKEVKPFLRHAYETYATRSDLYVFFIERSLDLLRQGGEYGVIVSNKFLRANYGKPVRALIAREAVVREIVDFGGLPVFPEATVRAAVLLACRDQETSASPRLCQVDTLEFADLEQHVEAHAFEVGPEAITEEEWTLVPRPVAEFLQRLNEWSTTLGRYTDGGICWGIKTGLNDAFIVDAQTGERLLAQDARNADVVKPLVVGHEVRRYFLERQGLYLLYLPHGVDIGRYPAIERYLEPYRERLEARATDQAWYELQQPQEAYRDYFEGPKTLYPVIAANCRFSVAGGPLYANDKCFFIPGEDPFLLAVLNSKLTEFVLRNALAKLEGPDRGKEYLEFRAQYMERLPIRRIARHTSESTRRELGRWLESLYYRGLKLAGVEPDIPEDIRALGARIGEVDGVERVILIGSWARGQAGPDSDVDLVVIDSGDGAGADRHIRLRRHAGTLERSLELHVFSPEDVNRWSEVPASFLGHVLQEGVVLYDR